MPHIHSTPLRAGIAANYRSDETKCIEHLLSSVNIGSSSIVNIQNNAKKLVQIIQNIKNTNKNSIDSFLFQYNLSSREGISLMCLAESLLRIPDKNTRDKIIKDKIANINWLNNLGKSNSKLVHFTNWGLNLTSKIMNNDKSILERFLKHTSAPMIRQAVSQAMKLLGKHFVMGESIETAVKRSKHKKNKIFYYSYDMLGEAAYTQQDADLYYQRYFDAIEYIGKNSINQGPIDGPGISIKLSALHPRYEWTKHNRVITELLPKIKKLVNRAKYWNIGFTIDAEEASRLEISLDLIEKLLSDKDLANYSGFSIVVQAYQKRAIYVVDFLIELSKKMQNKLMIRLVKGAYWDSEIKWSQELGLEGYPVFTRKFNTDLAYIVCAQKIIEAHEYIYPQFATHNAHTISTILELVNNKKIDFEFQCLHGMGNDIYQNVLKLYSGIKCRVYAPVGSHEHLLAYLVRRLLENGANSSFVNQISDKEINMDTIIADPIHKVNNYKNKFHPKIPLPLKLFGSSRVNSMGIDLSYPNQISPIMDKIKQFKDYNWQAGINFKKDLTNKSINSDQINIFSPNNNNHKIGTAYMASPDQLEQILQNAENSFLTWEKTDIQIRAKYLQKMAELLADNLAELIALLVYEGGKTINDAISEVREAIDFCNYYAMMLLKDFAIESLPGPTGEDNKILLSGRGVLVCISPWNFPLAIFIGQVTAALAAGNTVIAKPASQTSLIAAKAVELLHQSGIPSTVVQLLTGKISVIGDLLINDLRVKGVIFTGSTSVAKQINLSLANRSGPIVPFIAETGGLNAMIVDSSALPEQVIKDVIVSAFGSAGQRCSALRILYVQEDVADVIINMLKGAMQELQVGYSLNLATDVGPVIDNNSREELLDHCTNMDKIAKLICKVNIDNDLEEFGSFFAPRAYELHSSSLITTEKFGPILHVIRFNSANLDTVINDINNTGYGLTFGIHSRIDKTINYICSKIKAGNIYVNRNMTGAVVGVQPFGGEGLSGTGPKAGGPRYLHRLATERTISVNTAAVGGNVHLVSLEEEEVL